MWMSLRPDLILTCTFCVSTNRRHENKRHHEQSCNRPVVQSCNTKKNACRNYIQDISSSNRLNWNKHINVTIFALFSLLMIITAFFLYLKPCLESYHVIYQNCIIPQMGSIRPALLTGSWFMFHEFSSDLERESAFNFSAPDTVQRNTINILIPLTILEIGFLNLPATGCNCFK